MGGVEEVGEMGGGSRDNNEAATPVQKGNIFTHAKLHTDEANHRTPFSRWFGGTIEREGRREKERGRQVQRSEETKW